jgi:hypothetical protein
VQIFLKGDKMDSITDSNAPIAAQMYAMKKSQEVAEQSVMKVLDSAAAQNSNIENSQQMQQSTAQKTGLGMSLDLRA